MVQQEHRAGDHICCCNCAAEFELQEEGEVLAALPTGRKGGAAELAPAIDRALIRDTIEVPVMALPVKELLTTAGQV